MNREHAKALLPIIQAFAEGKQIEVHVGTGWIPLTYYNPSFESPPELYRIKREPRVLYINEYDGVKGPYLGGAYLTPEGAENGRSGATQFLRCVKMIEVIE